MPAIKDVELMPAQLSLIEYCERNESRSDIMWDIRARVLVRRSKKVAARDARVSSEIIKVSSPNVNIKRCG